MKKFKKIKYRINFPETNSSSTHSLIINPDFIVSPEDMENIKSELSSRAEDGKLTIYSSDFGWEIEQHNEIYVKIQYAVAQLCTRYSYGSDRVNTPALSKKISYIKYLITKYTGIEDVQIELGGVVDHQSSDLMDEIFESPKTLENFLFNKKSWLYLSNDNGGDDCNIYEYEDNIDYGYCRLLIPPGEVSTIELPLHISDMNLNYTLEENSYMLYSIGIKDGKSIANPNNSDPNILKYSRIFTKIDGTWYVMWIAEEVLSTIKDSLFRGLPWELNMELESSPEIDTKSSNLRDEFAEDMERIKKLIKEQSPKIFLVEAKIYSKELGTTLKESK